MHWTNRNLKMFARRFETPCTAKKSKQVDTLHTQGGTFRMRKEPGRYMHVMVHFDQTDTCERFGAVRDLCSCKNIMKICDRCDCDLYAVSLWQKLCSEVQKTHNQNAQQKNGTQPRINTRNQTCQSRVDLEQETT